MELKRLAENLKLLPILTLIHLALLFPGSYQEENKYTKEANLNYKEIRDPFRMAKVNAVWHKALHKLSDNKLKSLYADLSAHDKEQVKLKRLMSEDLDKDGLQEALVRNKFRNLLSNYGLLEHFVDGAKPIKPHDTSRDQNHINKSLFKDKKLAKMWEKAERAGFDQKELKLLKEEFLHHQDKVDEYYSVLEKNGEHDRPANFLKPLDEIEQMDHDDKSRLPSKKYPNGGLPVVNDVRTKHREIKNGYDDLHKKVASGPDSQEFSEPRVMNLWTMALKSDFTPEELESLKQELKHYEKRLEKLQYFQSEYLVKKTNSGNADKDFLHNEKDATSFYADKIKRHERHVEKLHFELENKIINRHEL